MVYQAHISNDRRAFSPSRNIEDSTGPSNGLACRISTISKAQADDLYLIREKIKELGVPKDSCYIHEQLASQHAATT